MSRFNLQGRTSFYLMHSRGHSSLGKSSASTNCTLHKGLARGLPEKGDAACDVFHKN